MKNLLLVDDHQILLDGVVELLQKNEAYHIHATAPNATRALDILRRFPDEIDVLISDISLPDMNGIELMKQVRKQWPELKVIAMSMHEERHIINNTIKAGVHGYVLKKSTHKDLESALESVLAGESYVSPAVATMLMDSVRNPSPIESLSDREKEIIVLITQEHTTKKIAEKLFISEKTVEAHKTNIFRKTSTNTLVGLTKFAFEHQLL